MVTLHRIWYEEVSLFLPTSYGTLLIALIRALVHLPALSSLYGKPRNVLWVYIISYC